MVTFSTLGFTNRRAALLLALALLAAPPWVDADDGEGLVSYWNFDDTLVDSAWSFRGNASLSQDNFRVVGGTARFAPGRVGRALVLDGEYLVARFSPDVRLPPSYTIEAWIRPRNPKATWQRFVLCWGNEKSYHFALRSGTVSLYHAQSDGQEPHPEGGEVVADRWQHIAAVADANARRLTVYLDGKEVASVEHDGSLRPATKEHLGIGDSAGGPGQSNRYVGAIDELAIWNVALDAKRIARHATRKDRPLDLRPRSYADVVAADAPLRHCSFDQMSDGEPDGFACRGGARHGVEGVYERGCELDGVDDWVDLGGAGDIDGAAALSVEAWIRWTGRPGEMKREREFVRREESFALGSGWRRGSAPAERQRVRFWVHRDGRWVHSGNGTTDIDDGRWHHVVGTFDGKTVRVFVDGVEQSSQRVEGAPLSSRGRNVVVGSMAGRDEFFRGRMDEVAIYSRALTPDEVWEHWVFGSAE